MTTGTDGSRSRGAVRAAAALPAPAQLSLRKGDQERDEGEEKLPEQLPPTGILLSLPATGTGAVLTWRFPREPREFKDRREKPAESIKG